MAAISAAASLRFGFSENPPSWVNQATRISSVKLFSGANLRKNVFLSLRTSRHQICCEAKPETALEAKVETMALPETVQKVCEVVKKQLSLPAETEVTPESTFASLGADSLDTVEIVMELESEFAINIEEDNSQNITTVQDAANLIEQLLQQNAAAPQN